MTWLLSASEFENDDVLENSDSIVPALTLQDLDQRRRERVDVLRIEPLNNRFQPTEQQVEIQGGRRPVDRNLCADRQDLRRSRGVDEFQVPVADQVEVADRAPWCRSVSTMLAVGVELDAHLAVGLQRDVLHGADSDAGDPHGISRLQSRRVGEDRRVVVVRTRSWTWPKTTNRKTVSKSMTTPKIAELDER